MFFKVLRDIARPQWFEIIGLLKRSTGLSVSELSKALEMSYMGVKQQCVELEKRGYVDTWRRPKVVGRPEKAYRLTRKAADLFPQVGSKFSLALLDSIAEINGAASAEKLLFGIFHKQGEGYAKRVKGDSLAERVESFAKIRSAEGLFSTVEQSPEQGLCLVEHHTPFREIAERYPSVNHMEEVMVARVLGANVKRSEETASGLVRVEFRVA